MPSTRRSSAPAWPDRSRALPLAATPATGATPPVVTAVPRGRARAALATARPRQWVKNALVIAAAGAAGALGHDDVPVRVGLAAVAFCLVSAGTYALNDVRDAAEDRLHPRKRLRPVAAGELGGREAAMLGAAWLLLGLCLCTAIRPLLGVVGVGYVVLTVSYTGLWRRILVLDIVAIAGGFVLRALAGGVAAPVTLSRWFVVVVSCAALFVAAGKRHAELLRVLTSGARCPRDDDRAGPTHPRRRQVLGQYTPGGLRLLLTGSGAGALFAYYVWVFELPDVDGVPWRMLTAVPFTAGMLRYAALLRAGGGESPEDALLSDRRLAVAGVAWLLLFALSVHAAG